MPSLLLLPRLQKLGIYAVLGVYVTLTLDMAPLAMELASARSPAGPVAHALVAVALSLPTLSKRTRLPDDYIRSPASQLAAYVVYLVPLVLNICKLAVSMQQAPDLGPQVTNGLCMLAADLPSIRTGLLLPSALYRAVLLLCETLRQTPLVQFPPPLTKRITMQLQVLLVPILAMAIPSLVAPVVLVLEVVATAVALVPMLAIPLPVLIAVIVGPPDLYAIAGLVFLGAMAVDRDVEPFLPRSSPLLPIPELETLTVAGDVTLRLVVESVELQTARPLSKLAKHLLPF